ncbi:N/A [soil metagenome]
MLHYGQMAKNTTTTDTLGSLHLFSGLSKKDLSAISRLMTLVTVKAGSELIKEGSVGREAFIIVEGTASVWRKGRLVASVGTGAMVGEMALLGGTPRSASVRAETDLAVEVLNRSEFEQLLDQTPGLARKLLTATIARIHELEPNLLG